MPCPLQIKRLRTLYHHSGNRVGHQNSPSPTPLVYSLRRTPPASTAVRRRTLTNQHRTSVCISNRSNPPIHIQQQKVKNENRHFQEETTTSNLVFPKISNGNRRLKFKNKNKNKNKNLFGDKLIGNNNTNLKIMILIVTTF